MGTEWSEPEEERVARWLRAKIGGEADESEGDDAEVDLRDAAASFGAGEPDTEAEDPYSYERSDVPWASSAGTEQDRGMRARLEAEVDELDAQRQRLAAAFDEERAAAERVRREQLEARARLEAEVSTLDEQRRRLAAEFEEQLAAAERVPQERLEARTRLEAEVSQLEEQRQRLAAAFEEERAAAERVRQEQLEARARLEAEVLELDDQRQRLNAAFEALRSATERLPQDVLERPAPQEQLDRPEPPRPTGSEPDGRQQATVAVFRPEPAPEEARTAVARMEAEVIDLDEQRRRLGAAFDAERWEDERSHHEQEQARAKLAATLSELGQHLAAARAEPAAPEESAPSPSGARRGEPADAAPARPGPGATDRRQGRALRLLVRAIVVVALVALVGVEAGSPLVTRADLDGVARQAAHEAASAVVDGADLGRAREVAATVTGEHDAVLHSFTVDQRGVQVVVEREAPSLLLKHLDQTAGWYRVRSTATAGGGG